MGLGAAGVHELVTHGHEVLVAEDGRAAVRLLRQERVDVLITDIRMPEMDGVDVLREAQRLGKRVYTIGGPAAKLIAGEKELVGTTRLDTLEQVLEQARRGW